MTTNIDSEELKAIINEANWDRFLEHVKSKNFVRQRLGQLPDAIVLTQICQVLINETTPDVIKILCLKCLGNSCLDSYEYRYHTSENKETDKYSKNLYDKLVESNLCDYGKNCSYSHNSHFPYDGVTEWAVDYIVTCNKSRSDLIGNELDILRLSIQFLCNLFTYACKNTTSADNNIVLEYLRHSKLKDVIINSIQSNHGPLASAASIFVHNVLKLHENYFTDDEKSRLCVRLLKPIKEGFTSAMDALSHILYCPNMFGNVYNNLTMNEKLDFLLMIYNELWKSNCQWPPINSNLMLTNDAAEFLALTFCKRSDLILKTVDTYVDNIEPTEVILILNILGLLTLKPYKISENAKSLVINCKYILMSLHMMGKESDNYFTPITNLSKVALNFRGKGINISDATEGTTDCDPQDHPTFGFKANIIRVIGNMVHKNKMCQDLFREIDGIPLLLDCCNIDARNPLILQWTIVALRYLCEGNSENQEVIKNCKKEGVADNPVLQEMGLILHEDADGKSVRIAPLRRN